MRIRLEIMVLLLFIMPAGKVIAGTGEAVINISTKVSQVFQYTILHQENNVTVSEDDIIRGYIDIPGGTVLSVTTNSKNGYLMLFSLNNELLSSAKIISDNYGYSLSESGGELHMPYQGNQHIRKEISFRFYLSARAKPGSYAWPLAMMLTSM